MTLFTVGPVEMYEETLRIMGEQEPYFRTKEFSEVMLRIERRMLQMMNAPVGSRFALLTSSGTGAMEAAVVNLLDPSRDRALIIDGGGFGKRFASICEKHRIPFDTVVIPFLEGDLSREMLDRYAGGGYKALFVQGCETSSGRKYDLDMIGDFCRQHDLLLVIDAVSAFLTDEMDMARQGIDLLFTASQKALALAPGLAPVICSVKAVEAIMKNEARSTFYFDLVDYFGDQRRGQTPFTCAVSTVLALDQRLEHIERRGIVSEVAEHERRALRFREAIAPLGFTLPKISLSNCCTPLVFPSENAQNVYRDLRQQHSITLCPSGGAMKNRLLRVGHMGNLTDADFEKLVKALKEVM